MTAELTGLILAGGAGRRMGGQDKGLVHWRGQPLVAHTAITLRPLVRELLISCNRHGNTYARFADRVVADCRRGYPGPLAGLEAAASLVRTRLLLVAPCDMPELPREAYRQLLAGLTPAVGPGPDAVFLSGAGREHYLCLALRSEALNGVGNYLDNGGRSVGGWLATLRTRSVAVDLPADQLRNINRLAATD